MDSSFLKKEQMSYFELDFASVLRQKREIIIQHSHLSRAVTLKPGYQNPCKLADLSAYSPPKMHDILSASLLPRSNYMQLPCDFNHISSVHRAAEVASLRDE